MRFCALKSCENTRPIADVVTFTVDYGYQKSQYEKLCKIVEKLIGRKLQTSKNRAKMLCKYEPTYGITIEPPNYCSHGWGRIYFEANKDALMFLQKCLFKLIEGDYEALKNIFKLSRLELAYEFFIKNHGYVVHTGLAKRIWWYLWPLCSQSLYASFISKNLQYTWWRQENHNYIDFSSLDDAISHYGLCQDGEVNGDFTGYIQACTRNKSQLSSHSLSVNKRASKHTSIYPKNITNIWRVRIEMELAKSSIKKLPFDYMNFSSILDNLPSFSEIYEFLEADFQTFTRNVLALPGAQELHSYIWQKRIEEARYMPTVDQIRLMRVIAKITENRQLQDGLMRNYTRKLSFNEVISKRLPARLEGSRRTLRGMRPDGMPMQEDMSMLVNIGRNVRELCPIKSHKEAF